MPLTAGFSPTESPPGSCIQRSGSPGLFRYLHQDIWASGTDHLWPPSSMCLSVDIWTHCTDLFCGSICSCMQIWIVINYTWPGMIGFLAERSTKTRQKVVQEGGEGCNPRLSNLSTVSAARPWRWILLPYCLFLPHVSCSLNLNNAPSLCSWPSHCALDSPHFSIPKRVGLREGG